VSGDAVPAGEEIDVAHVVGLEDDDRRRPARLEASPDLAGAGWRRERIEQHQLAA